MTTIYVAYATTDQQVEKQISVAAHCNVALAIRSSGILEDFPEIDLATAIIGIHSRKVTLDAALQAGDRIEIYRPLVIDPKTARSLRAKRAQQATVA